MKRLITYTFVIALLMTTLACGLTAPATQLPTTPTSKPTDLPTLSDAPTATQTPNPPPTDFPATTVPETTVSETTVPTLEPTATPTTIPTNEPTIQPPTPANATRIQFAAGGTWTELTATGQANQSATFVLGAAKGQIMGVSVYEGPGYYLTITGADGTPLTPPDTDAYFWRGTLPATQDYVVAVLAPFDGPFTLRVAINPPGQSEQTFTYSDENISLTYSDAFAPVLYPYNFLQRANSTLALNVLDQSFYEKTNLSEAFFVLNWFDDPAIVASCYDEYYEPETVIGPVTINGITFQESTAMGAAAGNVYDQTIYRTVQNNVCMEVIFFMHYGNIGNYPPEIKEFDRAALIQMFEEILGTLTVK